MQRNIREEKKKFSHAPVAWFSLCRTQTCNCAIIYSSNRGRSENIWPGHITLGMDENSYINFNNQDLPIGKKCWDFVVYTLEEVITFCYIISYTTQILLKVNSSSIHEDFWCVFQEFIINQGINGLFGGTGWKPYKETKFFLEKNHCF